MLGGDPEGEMRTQQPSKRCDCGGHAVVTATESPWEFDWRCVCGRKGWLSWNHAHPAPQFTPLVVQPDLFAEGR